MAATERPLEARVGELWSRLQAQLGGTGFRLATGENSLAMVIDETFATDEPYVAKLPLEDTCTGRQALGQEAQITALVSGAEIPSAVALPDYLDVGDLDNNFPNCHSMVRWHEDEVDYLVTSYVPGYQLSSEQIRHDFSESELRELGATLGDIIFLFAKVVSLADFESFTRCPALPYKVFELKKILSEAAGTINEATKSTLLAVVEEYDAMTIPGLRAYEELAGTDDFIGQNDLHPRNMKFIGKRGHRRLSGLVDLGSVGPSNLPRELRHILPFGDCAVRAAAAAYYEKKGETYDEVTIMDQTGYWSVVQLAVNSFFRALHGTSPGSLPGSVRALGELWFQNA